MTEETDPVVDRRSVLRLGAGTLATTVAGCQWGTDRETESETTARTTGRESPTENPSANETAGSEASGETEEAEETTAERQIPYSDEFETVVDVVADGGADPNAEESILPLLNEYAGDDTLLYFPEGRYLMDDIWILPDFSNLGVVGDEATFVPQDGYNGYMFIFGLPGRDSAGLRFEGFEFDFQAPRTHPRPVQVQIADQFVVQDVTAVGTSGTARFDVTTPEGEGVVRRLRLPDGGMEPNPVGCLVGPENKGTLTFEDCYISGFPGNGLYASPSNGRVDVIGGVYENSGIANVRVSGPSTVRNVTVRCNEAPSGFRNMRGIRLRHGRPLLVEGCTVEMTEVTYSEGAIVLEPLVESATLRNNRIVASADGVPALNAKSGEQLSGDGSFDCVDLEISGSAGRRDTIQVVDRNGCRFEGIEIEQTGSNRNGLHLIRSSDGELRNATIDVTGEPLVLEESQIEQQNLKIAGDVEG